METRTLPPLALLALSPLALSRPEPAPPQEKIETAIWVSLDTPLFVEQFAKLDMKMEGEGVADVNLRAETQFVDRYTLIDSDARLREATRHFLKSWAEINDEIADPSWTAVEASFRIEGDDVSVQLPEGWRLSTRDLQRMLDYSDTLWLWAKFPDELALQETFQLDLEPLAALVFGDEVDYETATADLTFMRYDPDAKRAMFQGTASARGEIDFRGAKGVLLASGRIEIVTDLEEHRIHRLDFEGNAEIDATYRENDPFRGKGKLTSRIDTRLLQDDARLIDRRPKYRTATRISPRHALALDVPSYWTEIDDDEDYALYRSIDHGRGWATLRLASIPDRPADLEDYAEAVLEYLQDDYDDVKQKRVSSKLGKGVSFRFVDEERDEPTQVCSEFYPWRNQWVLLQLTGTGEVCDEALKELDKIRRTLRNYRF